ncbi:MAG: DAK2 domain-containing protein, partial [Clostridia bacterium]|nr:DAK2 domain-containing protein [Clostridia bacterium]
LDAGVGKVASDFAFGALMGARGNSGVILSQMFRGFSLALAGKIDCDSTDLAAALKKGVDLSSKSVMKPVEGTILTVFRELANAAQAAAARGADLHETMEAAIAAGDTALANTPNQLPVLKEAGVVDAGGAGLLFFMRGGMMAVEGRLDEAAEFPLPAPAVAEQPIETASAASYTRDDISTAQIEFTFCTQLLIKGENLPLDDIREHLAQDPPGDSLLVVGDDTLIKIHFHNNRPWQVLEYCSQFGTLHDIIIDNMTDQHHETMALQDNPESAAAEMPSPAPSEPAVDAAACGVIAVCAGEGMSSIFSDLGATVISGGQTMNPSAEDLLHAVEQNPAKEIVILPNNSNIILTAEQVVSLTAKPVQVIRSKYVTQGLTAMLAFDAGQSSAANAEMMSDTLEQIVNGELTYAIRPAKYNGFAIEEGDTLGLLNGEIVDCGKDLRQTLLALLEKMIAARKDSEIISLYRGEGMDQAQAQHFIEELEQKYPDHEVELYYGGQPLYYFLLAVE